MPTKPGKDSLRTATAIFNKKCLQFATEGRPDGLVSRSFAQPFVLTITLCTCHEVISKEACQFLTQPLWTYLTVVDRVKQHDPVGFAVEKQRPAGLDGQGGQVNCTVVFIPKEPLQHHFAIYRFAKKPEDKNPEVLFRMNNETHFRNLKYFFW